MLIMAMLIMVMLIIDHSHDLNQALGISLVCWSVYWVAIVMVVITIITIIISKWPQSWSWRGTVDIWSQFTLCEWLVVTCSVQGKSMSMSFTVTELIQKKSNWLKMTQVSMRGLVIPLIMSIKSRVVVPKEAHIWGWVGVSYFGIHTLPLVKLGLNWESEGWKTGVGGRL